MSLESGEMLRTIEDLVALAPRATGSEGGRKAAEYVSRRFGAAGLEMRTLEVDSYAWKAEQHGLEVAGERFDCSPILHSGLASHDWTGRAEHRLEAGVVDIGSDPVSKHDVRGRIVLFDLRFTMTLAHMLPFALYIHDPERVMRRRDVLGSRNPYITSLGRVMREAAKAGAVGVIGVLRDYPESNRYHNEYYRKTLFALPGVWVTRREGERLRAALRSGSGVDRRASLALDVSRQRVVSKSVIGVLPGRTRETIMVQSHHDSIGPGAVEDASGTAEVIALAEHYGALARGGDAAAQREKTLLFVTFDTHFTGYHAHMEFARRYVLNRRSPYDIVLNATIEHVGLRAVQGADDGFEVLPETEPRGIFVNVNPAFTRRLARLIRKHRLASTSILGASLLEASSSGIPTDASFTFVSGVPTVSLVSGPLYLYDDADDLRCIDVEQLGPVAEFFADVVDDAEAHRGSLRGVLPSPLRRLLPRGRW